MRLLKPKLFDQTARTLLRLVPFILLTAWSCKPSATITTGTLGDWEISASFEGVSRSAATGFTIGSQAYLGTGADRSNKPLHDFWMYEPSKNAWTQRYDFPGVDRSEAVGFSINGKGYIGLGIDATGKPLRDFYEYDPTTNNWRKIADFGGSARRSAIAFSIGGKGYVGFGDDFNNTNDLWAYNPGADTWQKRDTYAGSGRVGAIAFVIGDLAYVGTGANEGVNLTDWWAYNPGQDSWIKKRDLPAGDFFLRRDGVGFVVNGKGYVSQGTNPSNVTWEYDPAADGWTQRGSFAGRNRLNSFGFSLGKKGYITTGELSGSVYDDMWNFDPTILRN